MYALRWKLLAETGFGLDLTKCAATGTIEYLLVCLAQIRPRRLPRSRRSL